MNEDEIIDDNQFEYNEHDSTKWHNNCRADIGHSISEDKRRDLADNLGSNWASIISGCGDQ